MKDNAKQIVFNDGDFKSPVMIVGEGPGQKEDNLGKPFVGDAGQLLDKMLNAIGQNRNNTYITNLIFWRPPGNRNPTEEEINLCLPFDTTSKFGPDFARRFCNSICLIIQN